ncbi:hypothetical protein LTR84_003078 [Exophiala bonariae]|uniref:Uncharacterized protein n=1 Tax=Exophiala bonariae TaxID=1690606 RepID=A0AAV9N826_9EURO|nr:hypothetical protein LTR84_003078 [Exophiala bonariae]
MLPSYEAHHMKTGPDHLLFQDYISVKEETGAAHHIFDQSPDTPVTPSRVISPTSQEPIASMDPSNHGQAKGALRNSAQHSGSGSSESRMEQSDSVMASFHNNHEAPPSTQEVLNEYWLYLGRYLETAGDPQDMLRPVKNAHSSSQSVPAGNGSQQKTSTLSYPKGVTGAR